MHTASDHSIQEGGGPRSSGFTAEQICSAIRDLRNVVNPDVRVEMLLRLVVNHGQDEAEVLALALAEVERTRCSPHFRRKALAQLQTRQTRPWRTVPDHGVGSQKAEAIRVEPELGRAAIALNRAAEYRLYVIAREITRAGDGSGKTAKKALNQQLRAYGLRYSREHLSRLLKAGEGLFWNRSYKQLYIRNPARVVASMTELDPSVFASNRPGIRDMYLSPAGSLEAWEATLYAGWLAHRENPTIARETLEQLFNRSADTLRLWEQKHVSEQITVRANYTQCPHPNLEDDRYLDLIPAHSQAYRGYVQFQGQWTEVIRLYWRTCNTYQVKGIRQHHRKGQASKVRKSINDVLDQPANERRGGSLRSRRYFDTPEGLKRQVNKYGGVYYLWRGENRKGHGIFELNGTGFQVTYGDEYHSTWIEQGRAKV